MELLSCLKAAAPLALTLALATAHAAKADVAAPSRKDAEAIVEKIQRVVDQSPQWATKPLADRLAQLEASRAVESQADRVFGTSAIGEFAVCRRAAVAARFYILDLNDLALVGEGKRRVTPGPDLFVSAFHGVDLGASLQACKGKIEHLPPST